MDPSELIWPTMSIAALLEKVGYNVITCDGDADLALALDKFLAPVLLKAASPIAAVRMKVIEVLGSINKVGELELGSKE
jgi:hypothetical protein